MSVRNALQGIALSTALVATIQSSSAADLEQMLKDMQLPTVADRVANVKTYQDLLEVPKIRREDRLFSSEFVVEIMANGVSLECIKELTPLFVNDFLELTEKADGYTAI